MAERVVKVLVLCEGCEDYEFARRALYKLGWNKRLFDWNFPQAGSQSGEQYVRENYAAEVRVQREREGRKLLVMTDADALSVTARSNTLTKALSAAKQPPRKPAERIAHWIPKRNLETWVVVYRDGQADESTNYKHNVNEDDFANATMAWGQDLRRGTIEPKKSPALAAALAETTRLRR